MNDAARAPVVAASGLVRTFAPRGDGAALTALRGVDVEVRRGEMVAIAGPSGSGKTTLLHLLAAIDTPTSGRVTLDGRDVAALSAAERADLRLRSVGLVFAERNLSPALTAAENVDLPLALRGDSARGRRDRVAAVLARVGASALADRFADGLSSGEHQRVALARAIAGGPALLVADEPTSHLDSAGAHALLALLVELVAEAGMAAVVASHDDRVLRRAHRVVTLRAGASTG
jgi:putative ABC transport system ATP-binding protein